MVYKIGFRISRLNISFRFLVEVFTLNTSFRLGAKILIILFLWFCPQKVNAQYDSLLHKSYGQNVLGIHAMYRDLINIEDSLKRQQKANEIKDFALQHKDKTLALNVDFFLNFWNAFYQNQPKQISLRKLKEQVNVYSKKDIDFLYERSLRALAEFYWKIEKNYELAFEQYLILDRRLQSINPKEYPEMARDFMQIGEAYYYFQDYSLAISYFKKAIRIPETTFNTGVINNARNTLGLSYQELHQFDSAAYCFQQILDCSFPEAENWKRIAKGNLGGNYYLKGDYAQALPLLEADLKRSLEANDFGNSAGAAISLSAIFLEKNNIKVSKAYIDSSKIYIQNSGQTDRYRLLYPIISKWYALNGNKLQASRYIDSAVIAIESYNKKFSALNVLRAQQKIDKQQKELQLVAFSLESAQKITERNILIFILIIVGVGFVLFYFIQKKQQADKELKLSIAHSELELSQAKLNSYMDKLLEKNKLIEQFENRETEIDKSELYLQLQQSVILTEADWQSFQQLFEKAHPSLILRYKENYPELTEGELRYFLLLKLKLTTKEMAAMLGVSPNAIQVMRHRLRKKLQLQEAISLEELIHNF
ncbi:MAG TPA: tetratricopeptide repeat protein [Edaphocola sp.]|nr:tetratricopeptide repeat protein [Edaphocola sp.]